MLEAMATPLVPSDPHTSFRPTHPLYRVTSLYLIPTAARTIMATYERTYAATYAATYIYENIIKINTIYN